MTNPIVAIVTDEPGWHGRRLRAALSNRGFDSCYISLTECRFDICGPMPVCLPGFTDSLPAGVFVRGVPGGTLEQVIHRLDILHALRLSGVRVYNDAGAIERTVDKAMTSFLLRLHGVPTPETWVCESTAEAEAVFRREFARGRSVVMKPLFGSQGIGVTLVRSADDIPDITHFSGVWYLQAFVDRPDRDWRDYRVMVIAGRARAAMVRRNSFWITNRAQGGHCEAVALEARLTDLAEAAARAVDIDYAGVDLLETEEGELLVTEVNSIPAWQGLQSVCEFDVGQLIVDQFVSLIIGKPKLEIVP